MQEFWLYFQMGLRHVLDINAYDHVLFLIGLTVPYSFNEWKKLFILVSLFTIGHTTALILSVYNIMYIRENLVEFVIPITILIVALYNLFTAGKNNKAESISLIAIVTLFFGIIHGLGFSNYFKTILPGSSSDKLLPLGEFALGIEAAQIIVVFIVLILSYIVQTVFRFSKRDWTLVMSAFIIGVVIPMIIHSPIWNR
ncbi:HupE/UreJ family protein [Flavobacterium amniphilum]|uniref:HupE/UreJ family protein n=1 Tax=Flavobacterium amniphilum TaxID=1834035 RepID=UPI002029D67B|nr:HupE/UreJ family protein [Flavobacterium amniphilum]MCL9804864.1 HupE/UreJ family protein [Flavobacterium amniphilum]